MCQKLPGRVQDTLKNSLLIQGSVFIRGIYLLFIITLGIFYCTDNGYFLLMSFAFYGNLLYKETYLYIFSLRILNKLATLCTIKKILVLLLFFSLLHLKLFCFHRTIFCVKFHSKYMSMNSK